MRLLIMLSVFILSLGKAWSRDQVMRHRLLQDKVGAEEYFRPLGHDFIFDISGVATDGIISETEEIIEASEVTGSTAEKIARVNEILNQYNDTEHFLLARLTLGIPLPSFTFFGQGVKPSVRGSYELGTSYSLTDRLATFTRSVPGFSISGSDPVLMAYLKSDLKLGLNLELDLGDGLFSEIHGYSLSRWDRLEVILASTVVESNEVIDLDKPKNTQQAVMADISFGYKNEELKMFFRAEELKISAESNTDATIENLSWSYDPLYRGHFQYTFQTMLAELTPFFGAHYRSGYSLEDGIYTGLATTFGFLPLSFVVKYDRHYLTLHPRFNFWFLQVEYAAKVPLTDQIDGFKTGSMHSINFRLTF